MGFPVGYTELFLPKLLLHILSFLGLIRKLISWLFLTLGLGDFLESDLSWPDRSDHPTSRSSSTNFPSEPRSVSAILLRQLLPVVRYGELEPSGQDSCAVCLHDFCSMDEIRRLANCRHVFHRICLDRWMDHDQRTCPLCRTAFVPDEMQEELNERVWAATSGSAEFYS